MIADLGSSNGTFLNDRSLIPNLPYQLMHGDVIRMGKTTFTYTVSDATEQANFVVRDAGWTWHDGIVNPEEEHITVHFRPRGDFKELVDRTYLPMARIAPGGGKTFVVQFLAVPDQSDSEIAEMHAAVRKSLDFYLSYSISPFRNPWEYAIYHCSTDSNLNDKVLWTYFPKSPN